MNERSILFCIAQNYYV